MSFASQLANFQKSISSNNDKNKNRNNNNRQQQNQSSSYPNPKKRLRHQSNTTEYEEKLQNKLLTLSKSLPSSSSVVSSTNHIAILILIIDELPFESIWKSWMNDNKRSDEVDDNGEEEPSSDYSVSVLIHAKYPERVRSEWVRQRLILDDKHYSKDDGSKQPLSFCPEWGSIEITRAMIELVQQALRIGESGVSTSGTSEDKEDVVERYSCRMKHKTSSSGLIDRFMFVSESCIPILPLRSLGKALYTTYTNKSWMNYRNTPNNGYARQLQWDRIHAAIPPTFIHKSDQWLVLTRTHASLVVRDVPLLFSEYSPKKPLYTFFEKVKASDEMYFPTVLALAGVSFEKDIHQKCNTYCDWEGINTKSPGLFTSTRELKDVKLRVLDGGFFFARKFKFRDGLCVDDWLDIVNIEKKVEEIGNSKACIEKLSE